MTRLEPAELLVVASMACWPAAILLSCGDASSDTAQAGGDAAASPIDGAGAAENALARDAGQRLEAGAETAAPDRAAPAADAASDASGDASGDGAAGLARGISGWVYAKKQTFADQLLAYDTSLAGKGDADGRRANYLFPYAGSVGVTGSAYGQHTTSYDPSASAFYATRLPGAKMLPNVDSADGAGLAQWSAADQEKLAADVAQSVLADGNAIGIHIDIEPFNDLHLPFYKKLRALLNAKGKLLTMFTGRTSGTIYQTADVVVLSGYDLGINPVSTVNYATTLARMVTQASQAAAQAGSHLMVGIPASASYEEYANETGNCTNDTGYTQEQWIDAALKAVCPHHFDPSYLGVALWQLTDTPLQLSSGCLRHPDGISASTWQKLAAFDPARCP